MATAAARVEALWKEENSSLTSSKQFGRRRQNKMSFMGTGRYANEQWVTMHPDLRPCVMTKNGTDLVWQQAPVKPVYEAIAKKTYPNLPKEESARRREFALLPGKLFYWNILYDGARPPYDSWYWEYFPDGAYFRDEVNFTLS
jgi:hypothetical protein